VVGTNWKRPIAAVVICAAWMLLLSGCLYPQDQTPGGKASARSAVAAVQDAVDRYQEATGVLPIQSADQTVPLYEKFKIDFAKMKRMGYIESVPKLAFENGGSYIFLIIDEESKPVAKLLDVTAFQGIATVQQQVDAYRKSHNGSLPIGEAVDPGFHYIDFGMSGMKQPKLNSVFSHRPLEIMIDEQGRVYADYRIDIAEAMKNKPAESTTDEDLRRRLIDASDFVPVKSPVYREVDGMPQAVLDTP